MPGSVASGTLCILAYDMNIRVIIQISVDRKLPFGAHRHSKRILYKFHCILLPLCFVTHTHTQNNWLCAIYTVQLAFSPHYVFICKVVIRSNLQLSLETIRHFEAIDGYLCFWKYRIIHKSLRDFRNRLRNNQDRHGRKEHINR